MTIHDMLREVRERLARQTYEEVVHAFDAETYLRAFDGPVDASPFDVYGETRRAGRDLSRYGGSARIVETRPPGTAVARRP